MGGGWNKMSLNESCASQDLFTEKRCGPFKYIFADASVQRGSKSATFLKQDINCKSIT